MSGRSQQGTFGLRFQLAASGRRLGLTHLRLCLYVWVWMNHQCRLRPECLLSMRYCIHRLLTKYLIGKMMHSIVEMSGKLVSVCLHPSETCFCSSFGTFVSVLSVPSCPE